MDLEYYIKNKRKPNPYDDYGPIGDHVLCLVDDEVAIVDRGRNKVIAKFVGGKNIDITLEEDDVIKFEPKGNLSPESFSSANNSITFSRVTDTKINAEVSASYLSAFINTNLKGENGVLVEAKENNTIIKLDDNYIINQGEF